MKFGEMVMGENKKTKLFLSYGRRDAAELANQTMGHEVATAESGENAIEKLNGFKPEIIFSDISMPGMTEYELIRELKQRSDLFGVLMVAMTGFGQETDRKAALEKGFDEHMVKPVDVDRLNSLLCRLSSKQHSSVTMTSQSKLRQPKAKHASDRFAFYPS